MRLLYISAYDPHVPMTGAGARGAEFVSALSSRFTLDLLFIEGSGQPPLPDFPVEQNGCCSMSDLPSVSPSN